MLTLLISITVNSQTEKDKYIIGVNTGLTSGFSKQKIKSDNSSRDVSDFFSISFTPTGGYFIIKDLAVGLRLPVTFNVLKSDSPQVGTEVRTTTFDVVPFFRYYFKNEKVKPFVQLSAGLGRSISKVSPESSFLGSNSKFNTFRYSIDGGISFFVNSKISIDAALSYGSIKRKEIENNSNNSRTITSGLILDAGFSIFL